MYLMGWSYIIAGGKKLKNYVYCNKCDYKTKEHPTMMYAIFDCPKCKVNYCDQCSYEDEEKGHAVQKCLRCDSELDKVTD